MYEISNLCNGIETWHKEELANSRIQWSETHVRAKFPKRGESLTKSNDVNVLANYLRTKRRREKRIAAGINLAIGIFVGFALILFLEYLF